MATLIAELKREAKLKKCEQPLKDDRGYYYDHLPEGTQIATIENFYDDFGHLILDKPYIIHSFKEPKRFWCNRVKERFPYPGSDFDQFLNGNRIYIFA